MKKKKKLIVIWDVVFRDFDYYRLELEKISKFIDIEVHDMNRVFNKNLEKMYQTKSKRKIVKRYKTFKEWKNNFEKINENNEISILLINNGNNLTKFYFNLFLVKKKLPIITISNNTVKETTKSVQIDFETIFFKLINNLNFKFLIKFLSNRLFSSLNKYFIKPNFIISNSIYDYNFQKKKKSKKTTIFKGNSFDFSNSITYRSKKLNANLKKNFSVLIDSTGPRFKDEHAIFNNQQTHTPEKWYPSVNKFFDFLEKNFKTRIKICPHPKTKTKKYSMDFGGRENIQNKLLSMIKNSKIVISKGSTAIIYAIIFKKPVLLVYSNEMLRHKNYMRNVVNSFSSDLNLKPINIDKNYDKNLIKRRLRINKRLYKNYLKKYATARSDYKPNYKILIEILNIIYNGANKNISL